MGQKIESVCNFLFLNFKGSSQRPEERSNQQKSGNDCEGGHWVQALSFQGRSSVYI